MAHFSFTNALAYQGTETLSEEEINEEPKDPGSVSSPTNLKLTGANPTASGQFSVAYYKL
jgi:hypothetical protein